MAEKLGVFAADKAQKYGIKAAERVALRSDLHLNVGVDLIKAAREADCDLIIMASHVPGFKDCVFSSNAGHLASHAPMSVYVVR